MILTQFSIFDLEYVKLNATNAKMMLELNGSFAYSTQKQI